MNDIWEVKMLLKVDKNLFYCKKDGGAALSYNTSEAG